PATIGPGAAVGLGLGIFLADEQGNVSKLIRPGDAALGGTVFDWAQNPWVNSRGDVAFGAHVAAKTCIRFTASFPAGNVIFCAESVYFREGRSGQIQVIAEQGGPAPGGGTFTY